MKIRTMTPRQSRVLALSLLMVLIVLFMAVTVLPMYWLHRHYDQAIEQQLDLLARYSRIGATGQDLAKQLEALKARGARGFFLKNPAPALAASEIQETAKGVVERNGGKIISMQIPAHKDDGNYRKVTVNIQMSANISAAQKIFYSLETQRPYLILDNISIRTAIWQMPQSAQATAPDAEFNVRFDVAGYAALEIK